MILSRTERRVRAAVVAVLALLLAAVAYAVGVQSAIGQAAEAAVLGQARFTTTPPPPLNLVSIPSVGVALLAIGMLALAVHGAARSVSVLLASASAILASQLLKERLLVRPGLFELDAPNTFPSGHMAVFTVVVAALLWAVPAGWRALTALVGAGLLSVVAVQLLAYGWHRPSDVLGALGLGVLAFAVTALLAPGTSRRAATGRPARLGRGIGRLLSILGAVLVVAGLGLAGYSYLQDRPDLMMRAGEGGVVGACLLCARALMSLAAGRR